MQSRLNFYALAVVEGVFTTLISSETILMQLHFRYELGFIPSAIDGKRHI
jgi:hypothetical protein